MEFSALILLASLPAIVHHNPSTADDKGGTASNSDDLTQRMDKLENLVELYQAEILTKDKSINRLEKQNEELKSSVLWMKNKLLEMEEKVLLYSKFSSHETETSPSSAENSDGSTEKKVRLLKNASAWNTKSKTHSDGNKHKQKTTSSHATHRNVPISHHAARRSDDLDRPWEPALNQMTQQLTEMSAQIQALKNADQQHFQDLLSTHGSVYVRWGRSACPNATQLVYAGTIGGSSYSDSGGGTNHLCLSMSPVTSGTIQRQSYYARLYGAELQTYDSTRIKTQSVPCVDHPDPPPS